MDSDALIKLTKASSKELVASEFTIILPPQVRTECVEQGKAAGYPDAIMIEENLRRNLLTVGRAAKDPSTETILTGLGLTGGEADVLRLFKSGSADLIVGDDQRFLQLLEGMGVPFATPGALLVALVHSGRLLKRKGLEHLGKLAQHISEAEYLETRQALEGA